MDTESENNAIRVVGVVVVAVAVVVHIPFRSYQFANLIPLIKQLYVAIESRLYHKPQWVSQRFERQSLALYSLTDSRCTSP